MVKSGVFFILAACFSLPACGDDGGDAANQDEGIEIAGDWASDYGPEEIADDSWSSTFGSDVFASEIVQFSNEDNDAILLADDGTYGRNVWTEIDDGSFYYCIVSYLKASVEEAVSESEPYDDGDLDNVGCGMYDLPWTKLTRQ